MGNTHPRRSRRALAAATMLGMVGGSIATMSTADAAVMVSGSLVDPSGNYAEGYVYAYALDGTPAGSDYATNGVFDIPLNDGSYKLEFYGFEYADEWYRDKADEATADVITVAGAGQTLAPWTVDHLPFVKGVVRAPDGRGVSYGDVLAYDAATDALVEETETRADGTFTLTTSTPSVKLEFRGYDRTNGKTLATEFFNDKPTLASADAVAPTAAGADVGAVTLGYGGSISGRVTNESGAPVYRAEVCADGDCDYTNTNGDYTVEGVNTGEHVVSFRDPIGEYVDEYWDNVSTADYASANKVVVAPGQNVTNVNAALAAYPVVAPTGVDVSGTVRDELGNVGIGYRIDVYDTPADPRDRRVLFTTRSNRAGQYNFTQLDRFGGENEFKIVVQGEGPREKGDFARRTTWSGGKLGYETATVVPAAPARSLDFTLPVAGGVSGAITSDAGGVPAGGFAEFYDSDRNYAAQSAAETDGTYDERTLWAGEYTVRLGAYQHVAEWWKDALPEDATTITVEPGQVTTGISASLSKDVTAIERPEIEGDAWVGKTVRLAAGRWNTQADSTLTYEWLVGSTVVATGTSLKVTKSMLGKKLTGRVTNDAGFALGQALTRSTPKIGYKPKVKAKVSKKSAAITLKVKPLKAKKVKATVKVFEIVGVKKNGDEKRKLLGKAKVTKGTGVVRFKKALGTGKHQLVFVVKGKGKVGSGEIQKKVKLKR